MTVFFDSSPAKAWIPKEWLLCSITGRMVLLVSIPCPSTWPKSHWFCIYIAYFIFWKDGLNEVKQWGPFFIYIWSFWSSCYSQMLKIATRAICAMLYEGCCMSTTLMAVMMLLRSITQSAVALSFKLSKIRSKRTSYQLRVNRSKAHHAPQHALQVHSRWRVPWSRVSFWRSPRRKQSSFRGNGHRHSRWTLWIRLVWISG